MLDVGAGHWLLLLVLEPAGVLIDVPDTIVDDHVCAASFLDGLGAPMVGNLLHSAKALAQDRPGRKGGQYDR